MFPVLVANRQSVPSIVLKRMLTINDVLIIHAEQIRTSNSHPFILLLPQLSNLKSDNLSNIFNYHLMSLDVLHCKQSPIVNWTSREFELFLPCFKLIEAEDITFCGEGFLLDFHVRSQTTVIDSVHSRGFTSCFGANWDDRFIALREV